MCGVERSIGGGSSESLLRRAVRLSFAIRKPNHASSRDYMITISKPSIGLDHFNPDQRQ